MYDRFSFFFISPADQSIDAISPITESDWLELADVTEVVEKVIVMHFRDVGGWYNLEPEKYVW
jgi:hypothetical protein